MSAHNATTDSGNDTQLTLPELAKIYNSLSTYNRIYTYTQLYKRFSPKQILNELDVTTRNALQHYIDDWKELDLIYTEGHDYIFTEKGEAVAQLVLEITDTPRY